MIRLGVIFKKPKMVEACKYAQELIKKGYEVCLQMVSITSYSDKDLLDLIEIINDIKPFAVALVDTYGLLHDKQMLHYFELLDYNLDKDVFIGYHGHNNFQLAYSNCVNMLENNSDRKLIVDGTCYGMGKSAGNAPLELLVMYITKKYNTYYKIEYILEIIDVVILKLTDKLKFGYNLKFFISASNDCHPSYIDYLLNKKTLSVAAINTIVSQIDNDYKLNYKKEHIEKMYLDYQGKYKDYNENVATLKENVDGRDILILGPGETLISDKESILSFVEKRQPMVFSVNSLIDLFPVDYLFISNAKRYGMIFSKIEEKDNINVVATSNITCSGRAFDYVVGYESVLDKQDVIMDNSLIMILNMFYKMGVNNVTLAGFDGFSDRKSGNYYDEYYEFPVEFKTLEKVNFAIKNRISELKKDIDITFLTNSVYIENE